ncbi:GNAT family N-acetyltransferase [Flavobacterium sp. LS1R49]|uniref:GNAT family N-acetyltransferase n=1 Tax=Flavobacterium shii TaxID=2987687 RepID=A0A9X2ZH57_9FLAO|nr:GNAT family N-acetyltransferase [Flavobacterium shii]MCV9928626.1 GNAT family N-acetyltransferase [Flavobacterium shii]
MKYVQKEHDSSAFEYSKTYSDFGNIDFRHLDLENDIPLLHNWFNQDYAAFWGMQNTTLAAVKKEYERLTKPDHYDVFVGLFNGIPAFLLERYNPKEDIIGQFYDPKKEDCGIHIIVAPTSKSIHNFTWHIFYAIMEFIFSDDKIDRILVEPDIRNQKMFTLCERVGFKLDKKVVLPHKTAQLAFLSKIDFQKIKPTNNTIQTMNLSNQIISPQQAISHLQPETWKTVNTLLVKKAICEFSHELLIVPQLIEKKDGWGHYVLQTDSTNITYNFRAKLLELNHLYIDTLSIKKYDKGVIVPVDAVYFILEIQECLGIDKKLLPVYIEEITSTLYGSAYKHLHKNPTSKLLAVADFQTIETAMMEGHPGFVANNGRIGFDANDYQSYAPEAGNPFHLLWLAGHKDRAVYAGSEALPYEKLINQELDEETINAFNKIIEENGEDPESYFFIPIHPWQWYNKLANVFSPEIANKKLICLGYGPDQYFAQQSIRTLYNTTNPQKFYTKTALSILNMGFMRGLPLYYLGTAPEMAIWLDYLLSEDPFIQETGFTMLGEIASVSYVNPYFEAFGNHNDYNKMLASLWRESPMNKITSEQRLMTMAAFLHIDHEGNALLPELIKASGVSIDLWLQRYLKAYLSPILHCFYKYDLVFMPHGENLIMVIENNIPVKVLLKDITEEAAILNPEIILPENLKRMFAPVPDDVKLLSVFTDIFDGFFRFMFHILEEHADYSENRFWKQVAENIHEYQIRYPEFEEKFNKYDLFESEFKLSCLNRLQLNNNKQMIDLDDPVALLQFAGKLKNPIAAFKKIKSDLEITTN